MEIGYSRTFAKRYKRLSKSLQQRVLVRECLFRDDRQHPLLKDHALSGEFDGCRSFSITGDVRVIYKLLNPDTAVFLDIGTHHELYGS
jgi:addiction module RelE/StbE family toxin